MSVLEKNFFTDREVLRDPIPYYRALRERGPCWREPHMGVFMVSGLEELLELYRDHERFSAIVGPLGPLVAVPQPEAGESWAEVVARRRHEMPMGDTLMSMDPPEHTAYRALIEPYFAPERVRAFDPACRGIAADLVRQLPAGGEVELMGGFAGDFALRIQCAFMGWPAELHEPLRQWTRRNHEATLSGDRGATGAVALEFDGFVGDLLDALRDVLVRLRPPPVHEVEEPVVSLRDAVERILAQFVLADRVEFASLFAMDAHRGDVIVTFLALLELIRLRVLRARQEQRFGPIALELAVGSVGEAVERAQDLGRFDDWRGVGHDWRRNSPRKRLGVAEQSVADHRRHEVRTRRCGRPGNKPCR